MIKYRQIYENKKRFFRNFSKTYPQYDEYTNNKTLIRPIGCHDGQRKLFYSELEFYTELSKKHDLKDILVVYVGSGEGLHEPVIFDMFPELDFFMCDPERFKFNHPLISDKKRFYFHHDYYTDDSYKIVKEFNRSNKKIAFICDIREDIDELDIFNNMISQQKWTIQLNSIAYLLKFRLPLDNKGFKYEYFNYIIPNGIKIKKFRREGFRYLQGKIAVQIFASLMSTENRLLYIRNSTTEPFEFENYDIKKYNRNCYYYNFIDRYNYFSYKESNKVPLHILGYDNGYESVCEYYLIYQYLKIYKKVEPELEEIIKILYYNINKKLYQYHKLNLIYCPLKTIDKKIKQFKRMIEEISIKNINLNQTYYRLIKKYYIKNLLQIKESEKFIEISKASLLLQKDLFLKGDILPEYCYQKQITSIEYYYDNYTLIYKQLYKMYDLIKSNNELTNNYLKERSIRIGQNNRPIPLTKKNYLSQTRSSKLSEEIKNILHL